MVISKRARRIIGGLGLVVLLGLLAWGGAVWAVYGRSAGRVFGADAYGYAAPDVNGRYSIKTTIREQFAKLKAVLDVIIRRKPKFLGKKEVLP